MDRYDWKQSGMYTEPKGYWVKYSDVQALQARVRELEEGITAFLPHIPTEGEALDNASLNEGRMGEYDRLSLQLRRLLKGTP